MGKQTTPQSVNLPFPTSLNTTEPSATPAPGLQIQIEKSTWDNTVYIPIVTQFTTISSRERSFQEWPHANLTPQQLARFGFYHKPCDEGHDNVCCFACGAEALQWDPVGPYTREDLLEPHEKDCLWVDMRCDARLCVEESLRGRFIDLLRGLAAEIEEFGAGQNPGDKDSSAS